MGAQLEACKTELRQAPRRWLLTGAAGFIGSNLLEILLGLGQTVVGLDNLSTGRISNLEAVRRWVGEEAWARFTFIEGDVQDEATCARACDGADLILHHAALVSVPLSMEDPAGTDRINVGGFSALLEAARRSGVRRVVYASSSAVYGDASGGCNQEDSIGEPLSPYALSKRINELQGRFHTKAFGLSTVGLRYFNVYGPRQDPNGAYAAVVPKWVEAALQQRPCRIFGDGTATRDFCHVRDIAQANLLAATADLGDRDGEVFNVGLGRAVSLLELHQALGQALGQVRPGLGLAAPTLEPPRAGDILHSTADVSRAKTVLGFDADYALAEGLTQLLDAYAARV